MSKGLADEILGGAGFSILVMAFVLWLVRGAGNPLKSAPPRPNELKEDSIFLPLLMYFSTVLLLTMMLNSEEDAERRMGGSVLTGNLAHLVGAATCLFVAADRFHGGIRGVFLGRSGGQKKWRAWLLGSAVLLVALGVCPAIFQLTVRLIRYCQPSFVFPVHTTLQVLHAGDHSPAAVLLLWCGAVIVAPLAEELFFRGILQTQAVNMSHSRGVGVFIASLAFALAHGQQPHAIPALFFLAVLIGYLYERTGALTGPLLIHMAFNFKTLIWDALGRLTDG